MKDMVAYRVSLGYFAVTYEPRLKRFDSYMAEKHPEKMKLTYAIVFDWLNPDGSSNAPDIQGRAGIVRIFAQYLVSVGVEAYNQSVVEIDYLSEKAIRLLIEQPDVGTRKGRWDMFLMILLYDTGARVEELLNVRICDVKAEATATILLYGKGKKYRRVPLYLRTVGHYTRYLNEFHPNENEYSQNFLFYTIRGSEHGKMSANNVRVFMTAYGLAARKYCSEIPENVHPHLFRHSRAMHLYQGGMDLTLVSQWLGHVNLQTTLVYAHADTEQKRAAIELATGAGNPTKKNPAFNKFTVDDEDTLKKLYGLR